MTMMTKMTKMTMMTMMTWLGDILPSNALTPAGERPVSLSQCSHLRQQKPPTVQPGLVQW